MTVPGNDTLLITALAAFAACLGYAAGRLHQWYRTVLDRDEAYRDGYDTATRSVFSLAARLIGPRRAVRGTAVVTSAGGVRADGVRADAVPPDPSVDLPVAAASSPVASAAVPPQADDVGGRHLVPDELVRAPTYRLTPDRVARAKVRESTPEDDESPETTRLPSVPRPRAC